METTLYHDDINFIKMEANSENVSVSQLKRNMTLDFAQGSASLAKRKFNLLQSPDLNMLKLASPELERMIIQANGLVTTTPTPTQLLYPKHVTEEQENYAKGFVDALNSLHDKETTDAPRYTTLTTATPTTILSHLTQHTAASNVYTSSSALYANTSHMSPKNMHVSRDVPTSSVIDNPILVNIKEEPQTVPCIGATPPLSPIDMDNQERIKVERKRARNRIAARKCRTRKLERISRLEDHVNDLKGKNSNLQLTATQLREQVCKLKQQIMEHVDRGCRVVMGNGVTMT